MGIDSEIYVLGVDELPQPSRLLDEVFRQLSSEPDYLTLVDGMLRVSALQRYYGRGYERGSWPNIYAAIRCVQRLYPDHEVQYSGDTGDSGQYGIPVTDEWLTDMWEHWLGPDGDRYFEKNRESNARGGI